MSKRKSSDHKSSGHAKPPAIPCTSRALNNNDASLSGMEDIAHGEREGVPFILVDGVAVATRQQLDEALARQESERMTRMESECEQLLQLESINPPPELDSAITGTPATAAAAMASLKAIEDELKFQNDLQDLCLPMLLEHKNEPLLVSFSMADTAIGQSSGSENSETSVSQSSVSQNRALSQTTSNLDHIRCKLEELRHQQEKMLQVPVGFVERPGIRRQATFDIKRVSNDSTRPICRLDSIDSPTSLPTPIPSKLEDAESLSKVSKIPLYHNEARPISPAPIEQSSASLVDPEMCDIVNQIGDLLMQFQRKQKHPHNNSGKEPTYSYMVTISPGAEVSKCIVQPINQPQERPLLLTESRPNESIANPQSGHPAAINIYSPRSTNRLTNRTSIHKVDSSESETVCINERINKKVQRLSGQGKRSSSGIMVGLLDIPAASLKGIQRRSRASKNPEL